MSGSEPPTRPLVDYINPLFGASTSTEFGEGKTFPGAATPFGLVQLSPDTITGGDNGPGYSWHHHSIEGLCGNEDVGQMSAWYLLSAMGFHTGAPVDGIYLIGSPLFSKLSVRLDPHYYKGGGFTVIAHNNSARNFYIQSARLNGRPLDRAWIRHEEVVKGGTLEFEMGPEPNKHWGSAPADLPPSLSTAAR